jgi:hypothetical protein
MKTRMLPPRGTVTLPEPLTFFVSPLSTTCTIQEIAGGTADGPELTMVCAQAASKQTPAAVNAA